MSTQGYVAFDLGAESGRAMLAVLTDGKLALEEVHRFPNTPHLLPSGLHWDLTQLWANLVEGLKQCGELARSKGVTLSGLGVDTWGVDFGLIGQSGALLGLPYAYRDERNPPAMDKAIDAIGAADLYAATGIQFMPFNTLFQLVAQHDAEPGLLAQTRHMLNMPDLLHYFFSGKPVNEATIASTTQMIDINTGGWATGVMEELGLPTGFLGKTTPAGTVIGKLREEIAREAGIDPIDVIVPGSHDTASAVAAVPVDVSEGREWAYLSSGTWSLMGAELDEPIVTDASREAGFTNERGVGDKIRFLKNISGLWLVQECRRDLARKGEEYSYQTLADLAAKAEPFRTLVDPNHDAFASPGDMLAKINAFATSTGQPESTSPGQYVRCCLESLALTYRVVLDGLNELRGTQVEVLHIVGGGGQNRLLNRMTADAIGKPVIVGPFEATAIGNALTQAIGAGQVKDLAHLRQIVRDSYDPETYTPADTASFDAQADRFAALLGK